ncbi:serine hydrolase domain-containing protein [Chitinophaga sancti]|uniref:CubicO group peptidase, beta-lactamase class C family n=1 Tax=Chitinophaga sancti TaxID=1004 RepID=A0A1K1QYH3_9BACT|nr:serine hydrolase domain-containing protein [Chitinophaga sancti]WQD62030.1 serine hydrolase domain-containing protein [Chitinophaga sancti]WQG92401.1 serine hydrolase domain-containing protein [Chitinophaga sancti]SFW64366.1 CubicO group peptidase, beta-lactamase class C family [Chitinophaga sancti]
MKKIFAFILLPFVVHAQTTIPLKMEAYMRAQTTVANFSGTVLVARKGKIIYSNSFGEADREWHVKNTINSKYRIGSITKQFTAACILHLEEAGKLSLDDKLNKYLPDFPQGDQVTLHMLLNQTTGIVDYTTLPESDLHSDVLDVAPADFIRSFQHQPYLFTPGTQWAYSNSNYFLLGYIIEKVTGQSFVDNLKLITDKAGLKNTGMDRPDTILPYRTHGYWGDYNIPFYTMSGPYAAGGMYATVSDLLAWDQALLGNKVLSATSTKKMTTAYMGNYGYGLFVDSLDTHPRIWHSGGIPGYRSFISWYKDGDFNVIVLSNNESNAPYIAGALAGIMLDMPVVNPYVHKQVAINNAVIDNYVGTYYSKMFIALIRKEGKLYRKGNGIDDIELIPESEKKFYYGDGTDRQIEFVTDAAGKVVKAYLMTGGLKLPLERISD